MPEIKECISRMVAINKEIERLKGEYSRLEAAVLVKYGEDTCNTKHKAASYSAPEGNITAVEADSVKLIYPTMLKTIFGEVYSDMVEEKTTYTLTNPAKKMLAAVYKGEYLRDMSLEQAISELPVDEAKLKVLAKKLKGRKYDADKANLVKIGKLSEEEAADYAYMLYEVANWCDFWNMLNLNRRTSPDEIQKTIDYINSAVTVETSPKITLKAVE